MKATTVSAALLPEQVSFIESEPGTNFSEKLRGLLDRYSLGKGDVVRYDKAKVSEGDFSPTYIKDGSILVFLKTSEERRWGEELPFHIDKKSSLIGVQATIEREGWTTTLVEYEEEGFAALWACKRVNSCDECKKKLLAKVTDVFND